MHILRSSIRNIDQEDSPLDNLASEMSTICVVGLQARIFTYTLEESTAVNFTLHDFQKIFHDWSDGEFFSKKKIAGTIAISNYISSTALIQSCFSHQELHFSLAETSSYLTTFWQEIMQYFTLPPTHVYIHKPAFNSVFSPGVYWGFCFIYLNNNTNQGVVLSDFATE